ncbi:ABC transporter ATP-binding protein [Paenibacillus guangzhouensis]|uniref:ABC transporter ATP-binding protein n=1 Tax=Paenibacillus guangzhouensis TaxID=1473112 RepID=UPI001266E529|nr:ATP-binding cassette domain-containing protein [Paenibacillus guangzhouensis]
MEIYRIENVSFTFPLASGHALSEIDLTIKSGEFITVCGKSGCGKSTLLRQLKSILTPHGQTQGTVLFQGRPLKDVEQRTQAAEIGFVLQQPDNQIVTDKVWHELAFGLESLGVDQQTIRLRVAEMASFFGIQAWFHKNVTELSGGQKQLLNLASIMAMNPSVLILDEPTSQLDPIAAVDFLETISKINRELGTTIILSEHRLEEVLPLSDRLIVLDQGRVIVDDTPALAGEKLHAMQHPMFASMPTPMQIHAGVARGGERPLTVKEGRKWLNAYTHDRKVERIAATSTKESRTSAPVVIHFQDVWFKHDRSGPDVIKDLSFDVRDGEFYCMVGGNGTGKTTTLSLISGVLQPYRGKITMQGEKHAKRERHPIVKHRLGVLPQNPSSLFVKKTVELDLYEMLTDVPISKEEKKQKVDAVVEFTELGHLLAMHPYDLSGGEQQRAALAKVLLLDPKILLLDEPTKGLDSFFKQKLGLFLRKLQRQGVTIVMVSHDVEFCAMYGERCAMFFDGSIIASHPAQQFFAGNRFYTTAANRMARHLWPEAVTMEGVIARCQANPTPNLA